MAVMGVTSLSKERNRRSRTGTCGIAGWALRRPGSWAPAAGSVRALGVRAPASCALCHCLLEPEHQRVPDTHVQRGPATEDLGACGCPRWREVAVQALCRLL